MVRSRFARIGARRFATAVAAIALIAAVLAAAAPGAARGTGTALGPQPSSDPFRWSPEG